MYVQNCIQDREFGNLQDSITLEDLLVARIITQLMNTEKSERFLNTVQQEVVKFSYPTQTVTA